jgi:hypothetical protein
MNVSHCAIHHVDEPTDGAFRVCFECGHVFATPGDLVEADYWAQLAASSDENHDVEFLPEPLSGDEIDVCPECAHNF